ncbi:hypothetical protein [Ornithinimicrobium faecis]|uniref:hypothetical protein n=1 Tax=Ornithinimicrobium faecis TaxID=2934158 RepID=UPI0021174D73|nr:hypothetical protein [Ornithinimicrobium sp. HY1745]
MTTISDRHLGTQRNITIRNLRLDPENPRLPAQLQGASQEDLAVDLDLGFEALTVAESIASHGFFASEPLLAIPNVEESGTWVVVEGNRRLTALLGLANPEIRSQFPSADQWDELAMKARVSLDTEVPVVVVDSRSTVVPIIGFRHIAGILGWTPFAQARYVAKLVDENGLTFAEVAKMIGIDKTRTGNLYREQCIAKQAASLGIPTGPVEEAFSLLTVAMSNTKLRAFVGAPIASKLAPGSDAVPAAKTPELKELLSWVFGTADTDKVLADSRDINKLGGVIDSPVGLAALRSGSTLAEAIQKVDDAGLDTLVRLKRRLTTARNSLQAAEIDIIDHGDDADVLGLLEELQTSVDALSSSSESGTGES